MPEGRVRAQLYPSFSFRIFGNSAYHAEKRARTGSTTSGNPNCPATRRAASMSRTTSIGAPHFWSTATRKRRWRRSICVPVRGYSTSPLETAIARWPLHAGYLLAFLDSFTSLPRYLLPMFPLGSVLVPGAVLPLHVFEPRYRALVRSCLDSGEPEFGVVLIERGSEVGGGDVRFDVGTLARIVQAGRFDDGRLAVVAPFYPMQFLAQQIGGDAEQPVIDLPAVDVRRLAVALVEPQHHVPVRENSRRVHRPLRRRPRPIARPRVGQRLEHA